jgi:hypothetical protein
VNDSVLRTTGKEKILTPDKIESPAKANLEGVPPRIRVFIVQPFENNKSLGKQKGRGESILTRRKWGDCARVGDEYI